MESYVLQRSKQHSRTRSSQEQSRPMISRDNLVPQPQSTTTESHHGSDMAHNSNQHNPSHPDGNRCACGASNEKSTAIPCSVHGTHFHPNSALACRYQRKCNSPALSTKQQVGLLRPVLKRIVRLRWLCTVTYHKSFCYLTTRAV